MAQAAQGPAGETRGLNFAKPRTERAQRDDGSFVLRSPVPLGPHARRVGDWLAHWAEHAPDRVFLADRSGPGGTWRKLGYAAALDLVQRIAAGLVDRGAGPEKPVMLLSDNAVDNGLLQLAAMQVGAPAAPVSPAYSLMSGDHGKLRRIAALLKPELVYAADGAAFAKALEAIRGDCGAVYLGSAVDAVPGAHDFAELAAARPDARVDQAFLGTGPDTVAKILFTSGSTGEPKGVINTQRMLTANQQMSAQVWPFLTERPPVLVDWLPWHHTFGGNYTFNLVLSNGGTLYVDNGKPAPGLFERSIANLKSVSPTISYNVPRGYAVLLDAMEADDALRESFFRDLDMIFYAAAALPQNLWQRLEAQSMKARGALVPMVSAWGSTETAPLVTAVHYRIDRAGNIGLPTPGNELKFVPNGEKLEMRVRGPNVTPGYWKRPDLTKAAFDEEGFYRIGDAGQLADEAHPEKGVLFDGRVAEDFKLTSGTWVNVGPLRIAAIAACEPVIQDAVVTGHDRDEIGLLVFASPAGCRQAIGADAAGLSDAETIAHPALRVFLTERLAAMNAAAGGASRRIARALVLDSAPSIDANEITDKGYINQRAVLAHRAEAVQRLYAGASDIVLVSG
ncbi:MAG: feruloyl-CoA synthase [Sneathiellaceae bacterium]